MPHRFVLALAFTLAACTTTRPRDPASAREAPLTSLHMVPIAGVPDERRALFVAISPDERQFTIGECVSPKSPAGKLALATAHCAQLIDKWLPLQEREFRTRFGEAFENAMSGFVQRVGSRHEPLPFVANLSAGLAVGFTLYGLLAEVAMRETLAGGAGGKLRWLVMSVAAVAGAAVTYGAEMGPNSSLRYYDLADESSKKAWRQNQADIPIATPEQYAAAAQGLREAIDASILL